MASRTRSTAGTSIVVAIDGPASSGKSSVGAAAAGALGLRFVDTGLIYRALTALALRESIETDDAARLVELVPRVSLGDDGSGRLTRVLLDGVDATDEARGPVVDGSVSAVARVPEVRSALLDRQRELAAEGGIVVAGRDIGTVVLPDANLKLFLDASVEERAARRIEERGLDPHGPEAEEVREQLRARDAQDTGRAVAPLRAADDARHITTDGNTFEQTVDLVVAEIRSEMATMHGPKRRTRRGAAPSTRTDVEGAVHQAPAGSAPVAGEAVGASAPSRGDPVAPAPDRARRPTEADAPPRRSRAIEAAARLDNDQTMLVRMIALISRIGARLFANVRVEGFEHIPRTGPVILAVNHISNADPVVVGAWITPALRKRRIHWLGKKELFDWPVFGFLAGVGGVHPVDRGAADVEAFRLATRILEAGYVLLIFPEGTRSPTGELQEAKDGLAMLAMRTGAVIVPIGVNDTDRVWRKGQPVPLPLPRRTVRVRIGEPFTSADVIPAGTDRKAAKAIATTAIMGRIAELLEPRHRGAYAAAVRPEEPSAG